MQKLRCFTRVFSWEDVMEQCLDHLNQLKDHLHRYVQINRDRKSQQPLTRNNSIMQRPTVGFQSVRDNSRAADTLYQTTDHVYVHLQLVWYNVPRPKLWKLWVKWGKATYFKAKIPTTTECLTDPSKTSRMSDTIFWSFSRRYCCAGSQRTQGMRRRYFWARVLFSVNASEDIWIRALIKYDFGRRDLREKSRSSTQWLMTWSAFSASGMSWVLTFAADPKEWWAG